MTIGFGIIGCGMISRFHAKAVADIKGAKVTACFDSFTSAADNFGAEIGCKVYHDLVPLCRYPAFLFKMIGFFSSIAGIRI